MSAEQRVVPLDAVLAFVALIATDGNGKRYDYVQSRSGTMVRIPDFQALADGDCPHEAWEESGGGARTCADCRADLGRAEES